MEIIKAKEYTERLEQFINATLQKFLNEIDCNEEDSLYDVMFKNLDELVDTYPFKVLEDLEETKQERVKRLVLKYKGLCFNEGKVSNWKKSIVLMAAQDYQFTAAKILDNIEFLMKLASGSEELALKSMMKFKDLEGYKESSVIEYLRNKFGNDELLQRVIWKMFSREDLYNLFTDKQKALLLSRPEGVVYTILDSKILLSSPLSLACDICSNLGKKIQVKKNNIEKMVLEITNVLYREKEKVFAEAIGEIINQYNKTNRLKKKNNKNLTIIDVTYA